MKPTGSRGKESCHWAKSTAALLSFILLTRRVASATRYELITLEQRWPTIGIIAIVEVGDIHRLTNPEGVTLESAEATIERLIYHANPPLDPDRTAKIRIYNLLPNGVDQGLPSLVKGRAFVMMKQHGVDAFYPTDPWEFQPIAANEVLWPTKAGIKMRTIEEVARDVRADIDHLKN